VKASDRVVHTRWQYLRSGSV